MISWLATLLTLCSAVSIKNQTVVAADDLCAPCTDGAQCSSAFCVFPDPNNTTGICSQLCTDSNSCPTHLQCVPSSNLNLNLCSPIDANTSCSFIYQGVGLNDVCLNPCSSTSDANAAFQRDCQNGLVCFIFSSGVGACVQECDQLNVNNICKVGFHCCYGVDANSSCLASSAAAPIGGCFKWRVRGDACVLANESVCDNNMLCFSPTTADQAQCYDLCPDGSCGPYESCVGNVFVVNSNVVPVCCALKNLDQNICAPYPAPCLRDLGVTCQSDNQCLSNYCLVNQGQNYCSRTCQNNNDCVSLRDGVTFNTTCTQVNVSDQNVCTVAGSALALPACAIASTSENKSSCGGCNSSQEMTWVALMVMAWRILLYRWKITV